MSQPVTGAEAEVPQASRVFGQRHRLVRLGFPVPRAVLILVLASAVCAFSSVLLVRF